VQEIVKRGGGKKLIQAQLEDRWRTMVNGFKNIKNKSEF
jgi:hypothetical protein